MAAVANMVTVVAVFDVAGGPTIAVTASVVVVATVANVIAVSDMAAVSDWSSQLLSLIWQLCQL